MARLFVAVDPPDELRRRLVDTLPRPAEPGVRWVPPAQWHVTLRFLGDTPEDEALAALEGLRSDAATATVGPRVSRLGRNVVCLPVRGLDELARAVTDATAGVGEPPDHPFRGHLTLGRLGRRPACGVTGAAFSDTFAVDRVRLYRSTLRPEGAVHELLAEVPLGP